MTSFYDADIDDEELLPSTCYHSWSDMDGTYVHRREYDSLRVILGTYAPIPCYLPPSFHQTVSRAARHLIDPFCTKGPSLLESVLLAVVAVFRGRIALKQTTLKKTSVTSGDAVEHKICVAEGTLLVVLEVPRVSQDEVDNVAQLFKAMLSATHVHRDVSPDRQLRVYGLLTDSLKFEFFSYDPVTRKFSCDTSLLAALGYQEEMFEFVIPVTNGIFSILLSGYIGLVRNRAHETAPSEVNYDLALTLAEDARRLLTQEPTMKEELEVQASKALDILHQSISIVPRETDVWND